MIRPIIFDDLFEVNENLQVNYNEVTDSIYIDNYYKNFDDIQEFLKNQYVNRWSQVDSKRNFTQYTECRLKLRNDDIGEKYKSSINKIAEIIQDQWSYECKGISDTDYAFEYFKYNILNVHPGVQHKPRKVPYYCGYVFLDTICDGGIAIYNEMTTLHKDIEEGELLKDVDHLPKTIMESEPNRAIIFDGTRWHGEYIFEKSRYFADNWRINQSMFFE